jgi:Protein of unknown function (DUF1571)
MRRLLVCLPLCMLLAPDGPRSAPVADSAIAGVADDGNALPSEDRMRRLAETDPIAFLENCIKRCERDVKGYHCVLQKQERLDGKLQPSETIDVQFREDPFSVLMDWREGTRLVQRTLYVKGENKDRILVKPAGLLALAGVLERDPNSDDAKKTSRYPINEFGMKFGLERSLASWTAARKQNALHVELLGEFAVKEAGDRVCWALRRTRYQGPEEGDGVAEFTTYIDKETWLQVGSTLKAADGRLLGQYFFRDIELNPEFKPAVFTRETLAR